MAKILNKQVNIYQTYETRTGTITNPCENWILYTTYWRDSANWIDTCLWND